MADTNISAGRTWPSCASSDIDFVVEAVETRGEAIEVWVARNGDGPSCWLSPAVAREVAAELVARADFIDPPGRRDDPQVTNTVTGNVTGPFVQCDRIDGGVRF